MTREEARQKQLAQIMAERDAIMRQNDETVAAIAAEWATKTATTQSKPTHFELDGEPIPYEIKGDGDTRISDAWGEIVRIKKERGL